MSNCCSSTNQFWLDQLEAAQKSAAAIQAAIDALMLDGASNYRLNTGQTDLMVTRLSLPGLNSMLNSTLNRVATLQKRIYGCTTVVVPNS